MSCRVRPIERSPLVSTNHPPHPQSPREGPLFKTAVGFGLAFRVPSPAWRRWALDSGGGRWGLVGSWGEWRRKWSRVASAGDVTAFHETQPGLFSARGRVGETTGLFSVDLSLEVK